jgi:hypothetical protein
MGKGSVTLAVDIKPDGLKQLVESGRLMEFVDKFSSLAAEHIEAQIIEQVAKASVGASKVGGGISISLGFDTEGDFGNGPRHWPRPKGTLDAVLTRSIAAGLKAKM